jgi:hypothetical protein
MAIENNFQRVGSKSNTDVGREFQEEAQRYFATAGIRLESNIRIPIGDPPKSRQFSLGSVDPPMLVICKSLTWTGSENTPSAKIKTINRVMQLFGLCDKRFRRVLFMLKSMRRGESLARYYVRTQRHLIGPNIEVWDFDPETKQVEQVL